MEIIQANEDKMLSQKIVLFYQRDILYKSHGLNKLQIQKRDTKLKKKKIKKEKKQRNIKENHKSVVAERKTRKKMQIQSNQKTKMIKWQY